MGEFGGEVEGVSQDDLPRWHLKYSNLHWHHLDAIYSTVLKVTRKHYMSRQRLGICAAALKYSS